MHVMSGGNYDIVVFEHRLLHEVEDSLSAYICCRESTADIIFIANALIPFAFVFSL